MELLSKEQQEERDKRAAEIMPLREEIESAIARYNALRVEAYKGVEPLLLHFEHLWNEAEAFREERFCSMRDEYLRRDEGWRESPEGRECRRFITRWEAGLPAFQWDEPEPLRPPEMSAADALRALPDEAGRD